jgi:8-amino-7-oxononanoate synthase
MSAASGSPAPADPADELARLRAAGLKRRRALLESAIGPRVQIGGREVLLLCANDYLGLAGDPRLRAAAAQAAARWGAGAGASPLVCGHTALHAQLERELASFKGYERCLLFGSGYLANTGVIAALAGPSQVILSDRLNHASIVDGCRYARAETIVYKHGDLDSLAAGLRRAGPRRALIVTDAVFSMDGDLAPLAGIVELAQAHGARVLVDEAHATGVLGPGGRGLVAALGLEGEVDVVIGTLGKALGSYGAFACCGATLADYLLNRTRTLIFSTALPPPAVGAALAALELLRAEPTLLERLRANAALLRAELARHGLQPPAGETPIIPLIAGAPEAALRASERALADGVFVQAIRPPTVPPGTSRLRAVATAAHSEEDLRRAAAVLARALPAGPPAIFSRRARRRSRTG